MINYYKYYIESQNTMASYTSYEDAMREKATRLQIKPRIYLFLQFQRNCRIHYGTIIPDSHLRSFITSDEMESLRTNAVFHGDTFTATFLTYCATLA